uniref:Chromo domain-containing protein n=1 Tax=Ananas comosus var. bracteatus TaxID=296719 RepID=A0A6V7NJ21_ANACO|nr:unnamed protein product [Ananas comosus var. bracteatus]
MYYEPPDLQEDLSYEEFPAMIIAREVRKLRNREIPYVKIRWTGHDDREATRGTLTLVDRVSSCEDWIILTSLFCLSVVAPPKHESPEYLTGLSRRRSRCASAASPHL